MNIILLMPESVNTAAVPEVIVENISPRALIAPTLIAPTKIFIKKTFPVIVFIPLK